MKNRDIWTALRTLVVASVVLAGVSAHGQTSTAGTLALKGKVVDSEGRPVAGAVVERHQTDQSWGPLSGDLEIKERVTTDANGGFELRASPGTVLLLARRAGMGMAWKQSRPTSSAEQRLVLTPPSVLGGVVVDEADKPVPGAEVSVVVALSQTVDESVDESRRQTVNYYLTGKAARDCFHTRTGPDGRFRLEGFPTNAAADLAVRAPGKALRRAPTEYLSVDTMQGRAGQEDIRLVMEPAGSIEGSIVPAEAGQPVPVARLQLLPDGAGYFSTALFEPVRSRADGQFRISDVGAGSYRLRAWFGTNAAPDWVAETIPVVVEGGKTTRDVRISPVRGGFLEAVILAKEGHRPVEQAAVSAYQNTFHSGTTSGGNGLALFRLLPGEYQVSVSKDGWLHAASTASVEAGRTNRVEIELTPPPRVKGVVHRRDGTPAAGLAVRVLGSYSADVTATQTDASGKFDLEWNPQRYGQDNVTYCLVVRDPERNLAAAQDIEENSGPLDLKLAPALALAGRVECDGKPVSNASATLVFWTGNRGLHITGLSTGTNTPGRFEIPALPPGRKYGVQVSAPGYGQKYLSAVEADAGAGPVELDPVELKVANLKLAGQVLDAEDKPVPGANVHLSGEGQRNDDVRTDRDGRFRFERVCEGMVHLSASARGFPGSASAEAGETNVVLRLGESYSTSPASKPHKVKGSVRGPDGKAFGGAQVEVFPSGTSRRVKTDTNGSFELAWTLQSWQTDVEPLLVARDLARNLAGTAELSEETTTLDVQLKPAMKLTGQVAGPSGAPLTSAQVGVWLLTGRSYSQVGEQLAGTDARGRFEIPALPPDQVYSVYAKAKGHGRSQQQVRADSETNQVELEPFVLKVADRMISGQVVNSDNKPISGAHVSLSGEDQPEGSATTDSKGRFKFQVCEGQVRLFVNAERSYADASVEAGDTNVVIELFRQDSSGSAAVKRAPLKGQPLPDLSGLGFAAGTLPAGQRVLLCLVDVEQRPSRRLARLLTEQHAKLKQQGLVVLAVQAAVANSEALKEWKEANPVPFPVGQVPATSPQTKWISGVESLPWLILTDAQGRVTSEGFPLEELHDQLRAPGK